MNLVKVLKVSCGQFLAVYSQRTLARPHRKTPNMASAPYDLSTDVKPPHVNTHIKDSKTHDCDPTSPHYAPAMIAAQEGDASLAPPNAPHNSDAATKEKRKSWTQRLFHHDHKDGGSKDDPVDGESSGKERKKSIADSGPYIFAFGESLASSEAAKAS